MDWSNFIEQLFNIVLIPLLGVLTTYIVKLVQAKINAIKTTNDNEVGNKYLTLLADTITDCVKATNQTYVDTLKAEGSFDAAAQKEAFEQTYQAVIAILNDDLKDYLNAAIGDVELYLKQKIEAEIKIQK